MRALVTLGAVVALAATTMSGAAAGAPSLGYLRQLGGNEPPWGHLFVANSTGANARDITPAGYTDVRSFAWSPDGRQVAFSAIADGDLDPELFVMPADGGPVRRLTDNNLPDAQPAWSPDGRWIAFASMRTGGSQVYKMRADGSGQRRLTNCGGECDFPAWAPRGGLIAFHFSAQNKIEVMRTDGTHVRMLLPRAPTLDEHPTWSPDGRSIAFGRGTGSPWWRALGIWTIHPDGRGLRRLVTVGGQPSYSPDGHTIAFTWYRDGNQELYTVAASGGVPSQLTNTGGITEDAPAWRPG